MCPTRGHYFLGVALWKNQRHFKNNYNWWSTRGLIIENEENCLEFLRYINYYRLSAYLLPFKQSNDTYFHNTTFERICRIYEFDRRLRILLLSAIEEVELFLRTQLAYHSAHTHGALGYLEEKNYNSYHDHERFMQSIETAITNNKNSLVVKHHNVEYGGKFPIWVIVDFFSIGNLSYFYSDLLISDKKRIAKELFNAPYTFLDSWMKCITVLRNRCAHYSRLYYTFFTDIPKIPPPVDYTCTKRIFDQILMLKFLYTHKQKWTTSFILPLETLINEYRDSVRFKHIGFPENWKELLEYRD